MLKHIVLVKFKSETPASIIAEIAEALRALEPVIPEIRAYEVGLDTLHEARSLDLAVVAQFDDVDALRRYQAHPRHVPVLDQLKANAQQIVAVDYYLATSAM